MSLKSVLVAAMAASASAFVAPTKLSGAVANSKSSLAMEFAGGLPGVAVEIGEFDPAGFSRRADEETLLFYRAAELKHGRVCMLAALGIFHQSLGVTWTTVKGDQTFSETKPVDALIKVWNERPGAVIQILLAIAAVEVLCASIQPYNAPGDFKWDPLRIRPEDPEELAELQTKELKNGRLAMIGVAGLAAQEYFTGQSIIQQLQSGHISPFNDGQGAF
ncbi:unnamed protein product [Heterosigma akashiwo]|uniref:Plastid light harvesting protein n=1 Tax=Heterosigma akashiwo TaxID=2829 RepID=A0A6T5PUU8_HETAK|mmetsp:Transcript_24464/g.40480  ORF Transcript_24464/g.40480 Transcript_24464/m.40480 type:complete len:219 (-) Transcript_24464:524-1180(-)